MKQEDKDLLLKDLCAMLPYGVKISVQSWAVSEIEDILHADYHGERDECSNKEKSF